MRPFLEVPITNPKSLFDSIGAKVKKLGGRTIFEPKKDAKEEGLLLASDIGVYPMAPAAAPPFTRDSGGEALKHLESSIVRAIDNGKVEIVWRSGVIVDFDGAFWRARVRLLIRELP